MLVSMYPRKKCRLLPIEESYIDSMFPATAKATVCLPCRARLLTQLYQAWRPVVRHRLPIATIVPSQQRALHARPFLHQETGKQQTHDRADIISDEGNAEAPREAHTEEDVPNVSEADLEAYIEQELDPEDIEHSAMDTRVTGIDAVRAARLQFGDRLPEGLLNQEEYKIYERLYGTPLSDAQEDALEEDYEETEAERDALFRETQDGTLEEVDYEESELDLESQELEDVDDVVLGHENRYIQQKTQARILEKGNRDDDRLQMDIQAALAANATTSDSTSADALSELTEDMQNEYEEDYEEDLRDGETIRTHPFTLATRFGTSPSSLQIPDDIVVPVSALLSQLPNKHIDESAARIFGGPALPYATGSPLSSKIMPQKPIPIGPGQSKMTDMEADLYLAAVMPGAYAATMSVLVELRKRLGSEWIEGLLKKDGGPRVLDAGAGGAGVIAWREVIKAEWSRMHSSQSDVDTPPPAAPLGKATVLTSSTALQKRASLMLENTTFLPRLPDYIHATPDPNSNMKQYDVIIAPYSLWHLQENYERRQRVLNLWSLLDPNGGVLILLEKGIPRGFEVIADARSYLLGDLFHGGKNLMDEEVNDIWPNQTQSKDGVDTSTTSPPRSMRRAPGRILGPCTNHTKCPMYLVPGISHQRKDWCHFSQRYIRPPYLQRMIGGRDRNHEDVRFSYIAVQKGVDYKDLAERGSEANDRAFEGYDVDDTDLGSSQSTTSSSSADPDPHHPDLSLIHI